MLKEIRPMQLLVSIVEGGKGVELKAYYKQHHLFQHIQAFGRGTVASHLLDTLGFGTPDRDVLLTLAPRDNVRQFMAHLKDEDRSKLNIQGIAFSLDLSGMSAILAVCLSQTEGVQMEEGGQSVEQRKRHSLILVTVNQGCTDAVMDTARSAGARGGTVIRARWAEAGEIQKIAGITLQAEKEVLAIVAVDEDRNAIMEAIDRHHGVQTPDQAMVISLPVDQTARLD